MIRRIIPLTIRRRYGINMASILNVNGKWRALIRRKGHPSYCQTFPTKAQARAWALQVETELDKGKAPSAESVFGRRLLVSDLIAEYRKLREKSRPIADDTNEHYMLKALERHLGKHDAARLSPSDLVDYCEARKDEGAGPYTVNMDIGKLGTVLRLAGVHLKLDLPDVVGQARPLLSHMNLIGSGGKRERRPSEDELVRVLSWLDENKGQVYGDAVRFAVATAMRRSEVTRIMWADVDPDKKLVLIRNRKDPRQKIGNDQWIPLIGDAWKILTRQPSDKSGPIFPIHVQTISKYFKQACDALSIPDLRFHDMRHEGVSRLFEQGLDIPHVSMVSGHKSWNNLKRYSHLRPEDLHAHPAVSGQGKRQRP